MRAGGIGSHSNHLALHILHAIASYDSHLLLTLSSEDPYWYHTGARLPLQASKSPSKYSHIIHHLTTPAPSPASSDGPTTPSKGNILVEKY